MTNTFVVYRIRNNVDGRVYFGSTKNFKTRMSEHLKQIAAEKPKGLPNYVRDCRHYGYKPTDFTFRVIARYDNQLEMLECEQKLLNMYWGTRDCYNNAFEVQTGWVEETLILWNLTTLEVRQYLSCHAVSKDFAVKKQVVREVLEGRQDEFDSWVVEYWSKPRTVEKMLDLYKRRGISLPAFAMNPKKREFTSTPGFCSLFDLAEREHYVHKGMYGVLDHKTISSNWHYQFLYGNSTWRSHYDVLRRTMISDAEKLKGMAR